MTSPLHVRRLPRGIVEIRRRLVDALEALPANVDGTPGQVNARELGQLAGVENAEGMLRRMALEGLIAITRAKRPGTSQILTLFSVLKPSEGVTP